MFEEILDKLPIWGWVIIVLVLAICICITFAKIWKSFSKTNYAKVKGNNSAGIMNGGQIGDNTTNNYYHTTSLEESLSNIDWYILRSANKTNQVNFEELRLDHSVFLTAAQKLKNMGYGSLNGFEFIINDKGREKLRYEAFNV